MRRWSLRFVGWLLACGDDASLAPIELEGLAEFSGRLTCTLYSCPDSGAFGALVEADFEACVDFFASQWTSEELMAELIDDSAGFDGALLARCYEDFRASCDRDAYIACAWLALDGVTPRGGACSHNEVCAGESICMQEDNDGCGVCEPLPLPGEPCLFGFSCGEFAQCVDGICVARTKVDVALGAPCDGEAGLGPAVEGRCPAGSWCHEGSFASGIPSACVAYRAEGEVCAGSDRCAGRLTCDKPDLGEAGTCERLEVADAIGDACDARTACNPFLRLRCQEGRCVSSGDGREGTPCNGHSNPLGTGCVAGFECRGGTEEAGGSTCQRVVPPTCPADCGEGASCVDGSCVTPAPHCE